jgi:hypothetical protein
VSRLFGRSLGFGFGFGRSLLAHTSSAQQRKNPWPNTPIGHMSSAQSSLVLVVAAANESTCAVLTPRALRPSQPVLVTSAPI